MSHTEETFIATKTERVLKNENFSMIKLIQNMKTSWFSLNYYRCS